MKMETNLNIIKKLSPEKDKENWNFRAFLKRYAASLEEIDKMVCGLYETVSTQIDCTTCANCCRKVLPILNHKDIRRLSTAIGITESQAGNYE